MKLDGTYNIILTFYSRLPTIVKGTDLCDSYDFLRLWSSGNIRFDYYITKNCKGLKFSHLFERKIMQCWKHVCMFYFVEYWLRHAECFLARY